MKSLHSSEPAICRWNRKTGFEIKGQPVFITGINYVMRHICTNFWEDWREEDISADLDTVASLGLNAVRIPVHWEFAEPQPGQWRKEMLDRLDWFVDAAHKRKLFVMPWFLVGVATRDYDVSWRNGQSFFTEPMISHAENHLRALVKRLKHHPNILCWDICDEPEWYSRHPGAERLPYDTGRFHAWIDRMYRTIKEEDPQRAVTLGFGHIATGNYGMDIRRAAKTLDVMAVTAYPPHLDEDLIHGFRSTYYLGWSVRFNDCVGKGVFTCEAPGWTDIAASENNIGKYYRISLFSNLANGAQGVMPWVLNDFDDSIQSQPPMDVYTTEKRFGIMRPDRTLKPAAESLRKFAQFVRDFPPADWQPILPEVGVLVPVRRPVDAHQEFARLFHHYIFLRQAALRVRYVWTEDLDEFEGDLLFLPASAEPLLTGTWMKLAEWVRKGGTLVSTGGHFSSIFNELFGVCVEGKYRVRTETTLGRCRVPFQECEGIVFSSQGQAILVSPRGADVVIQDSCGRPIVTVNAYGKGRAVYMTLAPEQFLAEVEPERLAVHGIHRFFRGCAVLAGLSAPVICADPRIELDVRQHTNGDILAILINHSRAPANVTLRNEMRKTKARINMDGCSVTWKCWPGKKSKSNKNIKKQIL